VEYPIELQGFEGRKIKALSGGLFSSYKLFVDDNPVGKGPKGGQMILRRNDGVEVVANWKPQVLGLDVPQIVIDGRIYNLVEPLKWYEWVWVACRFFSFSVGVRWVPSLGLSLFQSTRKSFVLQ